MTYPFYADDPDIPDKRYPRKYHPGDCPKCWSVASQVELIATTNHHKYYCRDCDIRFDMHGEIILRTSGVGWDSGPLLHDARLRTEAV
jgi:hypothetical protein